jgi:V8-like Glu-specific endopeptidase
MPLIRANRASIDDRFSVVGFTIRTESPLFEVGVATDPELFRVENRSRRNRRNFFSSRGAGGLRARRGEAVYLVPGDVLVNFLGNRRLYFGLATYSDNNRQRPDFVQAPGAGSAYIDMAGLTERGLRRLAVRPTSGAGYGNGGNGADPSLMWGGDAIEQPAAAPAAPPPAKPNGAAKSNGAAKPVPSAGAPAAAAAPAVAQEYDDGYGAMPERQSGADDAAHGVEGPIPDAGAASAQGLRPARPAKPLDAPSPEYPKASRFVPAANGNFRAVSAPRTISRVVIHITDGGRSINGPISWFQNPQAGVSAHYIVGQDGEVVQMVRDNDVAWHARAANGDSIGIEHVANTRGLAPTADEYRASAALVAWLCGQFSIPVDRTHILGHSEADPGTSHSGCPNAVWDWDTYMGLVSAANQPAPAAAASSAAALALASGRKRLRQLRATAQELLVKNYGGGGLAEQIKFFADSVAWFAGVPSTGAFPHSAICQVRIPISGGDTESATAFYIGPRLLLTAAHVVSGADSLIIVPGKNGAGADSTTEPFGRFTVSSGDWVVHESYQPNNHDFDLAVIRTPQDAPNHQWFTVLEELTQSRPEGVVVCGYSMQSNQSDAVSRIVNTLINPNVQHLHAGEVRTLPDDEEFDYDIQTLPGASGSPVYWIEAGSGCIAHLVGVHVAGASESTNMGCRLTNAKIGWINARGAELATAQSLALRPKPAAKAQAAAAGRRPHRARGKALTIDQDDIEKAQKYGPAWADLFNWKVPDWMNGYLAGRNMSVQRIEDAAGELNLDRYEVRITTLPSTAASAVALLAYLRTHLNDFVDTRMSEFIPYTPGDDDVKWTSSSPVGTVLKIDLAGPDNAAVVASLVEDQRWRFTTVHTPWSGDHPVSGHREFGVRSDDDGTTVVYTRAADRATDGILETLVFAGGDQVWKGLQRRLVDWVNANGGSASAPDPFSERFHPEVVRILFGGSTATAASLAIAARRTLPAKTKALADLSSFAVHWDTTPYYPQTSGRSCWAASAAMLTGWRDQRQVTDREIADKVPVFDAYKTGLFPADRRALADAWNLVPEPPASYAIGDWRDLLTKYGPIYIDMTWDTSGSGGHARVLVGMQSEGAPDGSDTTIYMHDPWPDTPGKIKLAYSDFIALYEGRTGNEGGQLQYQILHADAIPKGLAAVTAAPFALTAAGDAEPAPPGPSSPATPGGFVRAAVPASARRDAGAAVVTPVVSDNDADDVTYELDQMDGWRHPDDAAPATLPPARDGTPIRLDDWPRIDAVTDAATGTSGADVAAARPGGPPDTAAGGSASTDSATYAGFEIKWQYTGQSVGNISIRNTSTHAAGGWKLHVKAKVVRGAHHHDDEDSDVAHVTIVFKYHFSHADHGDEVAVTKVRLSGDGSRRLDFHWAEA